MIGACTHTGASNQYSEVTTKEGVTYRLGLKLPAEAPKNIQSALDKKALVSLPETFDWRERVELSPIEDQGNFGCCWAFSTTATFQDVLRIFGDKTDLSEQYLVSCNKEGYDCVEGGSFVHDMHMAPAGGVKASDYPYVGENRNCKAGLQFGQQIADWKYVPGGTNTDVNEIKAAIYKYGPVSTTIAVDDRLANYRGGVFSDTGYRQLNHAVNIVGWGKDYFIVRNSWSKNWGENGWLRIKFGANGVGSWTSYIVYKPIPEPNPNPNPPECSPKPVADIGLPATIWVKRGSKVKMGTRALEGTTYTWEGVPPFSAGKVNAPAIVLAVTRNVKITLTATTKCGSATDTVQVWVK